LKVVIDIEANGLENPTQIWVVVCKDIATGQLHIFRHLTKDENEKRKFLEFSQTVGTWIGHNWLGYDYPVLHSLIGLHIPSVAEHSCDTLICSKLIDYSRTGHSIEDYGKEFGQEKIKFDDWSKWSQEMETYCIRDVEIAEKIHDKYRRYINDPKRQRAIRLEHSFQCVVNDLHSNGFAFDREKAEKLLEKVERELSGLDVKILEAFPPKLTLIREITPKVTKYGTLSRTDFRWHEGPDLSEYNGGPFCRCAWNAFNPSSHKQLVDVLHAANWQPVDKTATHIQFLRDNRKIIGRLEKRPRNLLDLAEQKLYDRLQELRKSGWKINENNLATLPEKAPKPARLLAKRILLESRRRTLTEWLALVREDNRIHGKFYAIGAWTHRMAHQHPNTANIPTDAKLFGKEMRSLWRAPKNRLLVGVDAEGIQLRIFAHYIDDKEFTDALVNGKKEDKTDPHSLNQQILQAPSRNHAKRFIFAYLLGGGIAKLSQILEMSTEEGEKALQRLVERYSGLQYLRSHVIPADAKRGWFTGIDGRAVKLPGESLRDREHLCMSGYLQNGEAVVMKAATVKFADRLDEYDAQLVNLVHDEWQTECPNNVEVALNIARLQADCLREVGEELKLNCPLAGSYYNEDIKDYTLGVNWSYTH
jgi:DNA polymerase-1